jgi:hypothetical protein
MVGEHSTTIPSDGRPYLPRCFLAHVGSPFSGFGGEGCLRPLWEPERRGPWSVEQGDAWGDLASCFLRLRRVSSRR